MLMLYIIYVLIGSFIFLILSGLLIYTIKCIDAWSIGWVKLAEHYPETDVPEGIWYKKQDMRLGNNLKPIQFNVCLSKEGLYLSISHLFHKVYAPSLIPWEDVVIAGRSWILLQSGTKLSLGKPEIIKVVLPDTIIEKAQQQGYLKTYNTNHA